MKRGCCHHIRHMRIDHMVEDHQIHPQYFYEIQPMLALLQCHGESLPSISSYHGLFRKSTISGRQFSVYAVISTVLFLLFLCNPTIITNL